jgi:hypothetical protein
MGWFGNNSAFDKVDRDISAIADGSADLAHTVGTQGNDAPAAFLPISIAFLPAFAT